MMSKFNRVDNGPALGHDLPMEHCFMIQSEKYPRLYYRNERARFWADNTVLSGQSATEFLAEEADRLDKDYLIIHPEEDAEDIPFDFNGWVVQYDATDPSFGSHHLKTQAN